MTLCSNTNACDSDFFSYDSSLIKSHNAWVRFFFNTVPNTGACCNIKKKSPHFFKNANHVFWNEKNPQDFLACGSCLQILSTVVDNKRSAAKLHSTTSRYHPPLQMHVRTKAKLKSLFILMTLSWNYLLTHTEEYCGSINCVTADQKVCQNKKRCTCVSL